jgi:hypothetical protein
MTRRMNRMKALLGVAALGASVAAFNCSHQGAGDDVGTVQLRLTAPDGLTVNSVTYTVKSGSTILLGPSTFDVSDPNAAPSLDIALPPSTGDTITLTAVATNGHQFTGTSSVFNIVSGQVTLVSVLLTDTVPSTSQPGTVDVTGTIVPNDNPPVITSVIVAPSQTSVGANISVTVTATDADVGDTLTYAWTATPDGAFANPASATTTYSSPSGGTKTLKITVTDSHSPPASVSLNLPVNIIGAAAPGVGGAGVGGAGTGGAGVGGAVVVGTGGAGVGGAVVVGTGGAGVGGAGVGGAGTGGDSGLALENAELATPFDPTLLTYTSSEDPDTGDQIAIGWGPDTLPSQAQRDASRALIRRIAALLPNSVRNSTNTANATPGNQSNVPNPPNGLLTLGADPSSLFSGSNLADSSGTALEAFRAAAIADAAVPVSAADPGGLTAAAAANNGTLGAYIASNAVSPGSAIGIAVNIVTDAVQFNLESLLQAF